MGFKIFGKKNGKRTVSDKPENGDTKVTEATKLLPDEDPEARKALSSDSYGIRKQETLTVGSKVKLEAHPSLKQKVKKGR